jgi:hypothetical protein
VSDVERRLRRRELSGATAGQPVEQRVVGCAVVINGDQLAGTGGS